LKTLITWTKPGIVVTPINQAAHYAVSNTDAGGGLARS
jgi:hypothetical protein